MCKIITIKGPLPNAHKKAIRLLGDPMIEIGLIDGQPSEDDQKLIASLKAKGHKFQVVTFEGSNRAYLVASR